MDGDHQQAEATAAVTAKKAASRTRKAAAKESPSARKATTKKASG